MDNFSNKGWFAGAIEIMNSQDRKGRNITVIFLFVILITTIIVYAPSLNNDFVNYDDNYLITGNPDIQNFGSESIIKFFLYQYYGHYHPLTMITYSIDYLIGGLEPRTYHTTNLIIHLINIIIVFLLFLKISKRTDVTTIIAFLFALHPLQTETVSWLGARSNLLVIMFSLLCLYSYLVYLQNNYKVRHWLICFGFFVFALLSKSSAVTVPILLLVIDYYYSRKLSIRLISEKLPLFGLSLLWGIIAIISAKTIGSLYGSFSYNAFEKILMINYSLFFYISMYVFPYNQSAVHYEPLRVDGLFPVTYYIAPFILISIIALVFVTKKYRSDLVFGLLLYLISLALVIRIIPIGGTIVCERYAYFSCLGLAFIVASAFKQLNALKYSYIKILGPIFLLIMVFIGGLFSFQTYTRNKVWANGCNLFTDVIEKYPNRGFAYYARGNMKVRDNKLDEAIEDYDLSIQLEPHYIAYYNRGNVKLRQKKYEEALFDYNKGLEIYPEFIELYNVRGSVSGLLGKYEEAVSDFNHIIKEKPFRTEAYNNRGLIYSMIGKYALAIKDYTQAIIIDSLFVEAWLNRGKAHFSINDTVNACTDWMAAAALHNRSAVSMLKRYCTTDGKPKKISDIPAEPVHMHTAEDNTIPDYKKIRIVETTGTEVIIEDKTDGDQNRLVYSEEEVAGKKLLRLKRYNRDQVLIEDGIIDSNGKYDGEIKWYYNTGKLKIKGFYKDVTPYGNWTEYYPSGNKKAEYSYENGLMTGSYKYYYESGRLWTERKYNKGTLWEVVSNFKKNGENNSPGTLKDGNGTLMVYDIEGKVLEVQVYKEGIRIQ